MAEVPQLSGQVSWMPEPTPLSRPAPVIERERIDAIDALRGFALLGILLMNIQSLSMPGAAYMNPTAYGDLQGANYWVWHFSHLLADQKFMTIFSMLFGAGIVLMTSRIEAAGQGSAGLHYRRMGWLILFGILHAHLLWYGDILYFYGMCGLAAWPFRRLPAMALIPMGIILLAVASLIGLGFGLSMQFWPPEALAGMEADLSPSAERLKPEIDAYRGGWLQQMTVRVPESLFFETMLFLMWGMWRVGGLMLIGMALYKLGVFSAKASTRTYLVMFASGALIGLPVILYGIKANFSHGWDIRYSFFFGSEFNYWASIPVSLAWVSVIMLIYRSGALRWLMRGLEAVGRMALTNYLLHTIICTTIFYGHGFGRFGMFDRVEQLITVLIIWTFQLIMSPIWLRHFQFGPAEWLWRSLTYMRVQPIRRSAQPASQQFVHPSAG